jgi:hypothetical protein
MASDLTPFSFSFNGSLRVETRGSSLSANAGALILRELESNLGLVEDLAVRIWDPRDPELITHPMSELLRSRLFALALGYIDQDDLDFLRDDPILKLGVSERRGTKPLDEPGEDENVPDGLASQPTQSRLIQTLSDEFNLDILNDALAEWAARSFHELGLSGPVVLDIDSFPIQVYGSQPGSAYSGHYGYRCFHPLVTMLSGTAAVLRANLRPGNVWTADGALEHLSSVLDIADARFEGVAAVRGDAGFPEEGFFSLLESRGVPYVLRIKRNSVLNQLAEPYLRRPPGRPPKEPRTWFHELRYAAEPWSKERRVVLVVQEQPGELFLHSFFLVTSYSPEEMPPEQLLDFYRERGTMEQHLGEIKSVLSPALSSAPRPKSHYRGEEPKKITPSRDGEKANAATFLLYLLAYNLMNIARNLLAETQAADEPVPSLDRVRSFVLKVAARLTRSARYAIFTVNEACRRLWEPMLARIRRIVRVASHM